MDRLSSDLAGGGRSGDGFSDGGAAVPDEAQPLLEASRIRLSIPDQLFALEELDVLYDERDEALWTFMRPAGRPSFTPSMLSDFAVWQDQIEGHFGPEKVPLKYLVLGSRAPGVFCFGGDLTLFEGLIRSGNRDGLAAYGYRCVEILHRNMCALDLPMLTIGLVQGQALGGGFEALLSFDYIIAERGSSFGLPEVMFGLFPGMGAHAFLSRRLGSAMAERVIMGNESYSAEKMFELGIVRPAEPTAVLAAADQVLVDQRIDNIGTGPKREEHVPAAFGGRLLAGAATHDGLPVHRLQIDLEAGLTQQLGGNDGMRFQDADVGRM